MMRGIARLTTTEAKLFGRDLSAVLLPLGLPLVLLLAWGSVPDMRIPSPDLGGQRPLDVLIAPVAVAIAVAMLAISTLPVYLATYRERGILRRLSTTPVRPAMLLVAQLAVNLSMAVVSVAVAVLAGHVVFDVSLPGNAAGFVAAVVLGAGGLYAVGLLIAALAPTSKAATAAGSAVLFPMMLFGGVFVPRETLPDWMGRIGELTPLGAALEALRDAWGGATPDPFDLAVLAATVLVAGTLAAIFFKWE